MTRYLTREEIQEKRKEFLSGKLTQNFFVCGFPKCQNQILNASHFKDELSKKEFVISGLCQECQDSFFKEDI